MILSHIVACSENYTIGKDNELPWDIPEDMEFFKTKTRGHIMIMGRKTFESLPGILSNRYLIIITRDPDTFKQTQALTLKKYQEKNVPVYICQTIEESIRFAQSLVTPHSTSASAISTPWNDEVFIIGGGEIYQQTMAIVHKIYLTLIHKNFQGDVSYPQVDTSQFKLTDQKDRQDPVPFSFLTYERR